MMIATVVTMMTATTAIAQDASLLDSQDCATIDLRSVDDASLTRAEKIAALDRALLDAVNKSDPCQTDGGTQSDSDGDGDGDGNGNGNGAQGNGASADSVPASDIQGDEAAPTTSDTATDSNVVNNASSSSPPSLPNGKLPDDIPPAGNDDIIAEQFRRAAIDETDPATKAKLWNEYRRYKGLPVQEVPET